MNAQLILNINHVIQKISILATGAPVTAQFRSELFNLYATNNNWEKIAEIIDKYMNSLISSTPNGVNGLVQSMVFNGFGLKLSVDQVEQVTANLISNGINSWSKLFEFAINNLSTNFSSILDYRADYAEVFTRLLSELDKEHKYYHSYAMSAAREWLQGIQAFDGMIPEAHDSAVLLIDRMLNGNISGRVLNGYMSNATVFIDRNENNILDAGESSTVTDAGGKFLLPDKFSTGAYKAFGGIDLATGRPFPFTLTAPEGSVMLTPLTTLTALILHNNLANNLDVAEEMLFRSLNLPQVDLSVYDHIASAIDSDDFAQQVAAVKMQAAIAQIVNFFNIAHTLANHFIANKSDTEEIILRTLVSHLADASNAGRRLDLNNQETVFAMLNDIAITAGIIDHNSSLQEINHYESLSNQAARILAEINLIAHNSVQLFENGRFLEPISVLSDIVKLEVLIQTQIDSAIEENLQSGSLENIISQFTGNNLGRYIAEVQTGFFDSQTAVNKGTYLTNLKLFTSSVNILSSNAAPLISNLAGDSLNYTEGDGAVVIEQSSNAIVSDVDSTNFAAGTLTVSFQTGSDSAEDVLSIVNQGTGAGQIGVSGSNVSYGGVLIGTFSGGSSGSNLVATFNSNATSAAITALVKHITYENTDTGAPTAGARTIRYVLTDGDGGTSANYDATVIVSGTNDSPVNSVPGAQNVTEDISSVLSGLGVTDADGNLSAVQLAVSNGVLNVTLSGSATISAGTNGSGTLTLSGNQTDVNATLSSLSYQGTSNYSGSDTLTLTSIDSNSATDVDTVAIAIAAANDVPVIGNLAGDSLNYTEGDGAVVIEQSSNAIVSDVDSTNFAAGTLTVSFQTGSDSAEDVLSIVNQGTGAGQIGVSGSNVSYGGVLIGTFSGGSSGSNLVATFNSNATSAAITALVKHITYENTDTGAPTTGVRTIRYVLNDGDGGTSANYDATVIVSGLNNHTETVLDQFGSASFSNNNGTANWSSSWMETDSNGGGASGGRIRISGGKLDVRADAVGDNIYREVNLIGATAATLSFNYTNSLRSGDTIVVEVSNNGGSSYSILTGGTFTQSLNTGSGVFNYDISSFISASTRIRYDVTTVSDNDHLYLDNVQVTYTLANHEPVITNPATVNINENETIVTSIAATDFDGDALTYGISGSDAALFTIDSHSGLLSFNSPANFEIPMDSNGDNIYDLIVQVDDGKSSFDTQAVSILINDVIGF